MYGCGDYTCPLHLLHLLLLINIILISKVGFISRCFTLDQLNRHSLTELIAYYRYVLSLQSEHCGVYQRLVILRTFKNGYASGNCSHFGVVFGWWFRESDSMASGRTVLGCILLLLLGFLWAPIWMLTNGSKDSVNVHDLFAGDEVVSLY